MDLLDDCVSRKTLRKLSTPILYKTLLQICIEYISIAALIGIGIYFSNFFATLLIMWLVGARQSGLLIISHDAVHYRMSKNKIINDWLANILIMFPLWTSLSDFRQRHLQHHQFVNTDNDPDYVTKKDNPEYFLPQPKVLFIRNALKYIFGFHFLVVLFKKNFTFKNKLKYIYRGLTMGRRIDIVNYQVSRNETIVRYIINCVILCTVVLNGWLLYYVVYWILPQALCIPFMSRIRGINEHFGIVKREIEGSRTMYPTWFDEIFLGISWNISYHLDHHLYPSVPSYNLRKLHKHLLRCSYYKENAQITSTGTFGVIKECTI
jgi:fatty acid desaturase